MSSPHNPLTTHGANAQTTEQFFTLTSAISPWIMRTAGKQQHEILRGQRQRSLSAGFTHLPAQIAISSHFILTTAHQVCYCEDGACFTTRTLRSAELNTPHGSGGAEIWDHAVRLQSSLPGPRHSHQGSFTKMHE